MRFAGRRVWRRVRRVVSVDVRGGGSWVVMGVMVGGGSVVVGGLGEDDAEVEEDVVRSAGALVEEAELAFGFVCGREDVHLAVADAGVDGPDDDGLLAAAVVDVRFLTLPERVPGPGPSPSMSRRAAPGMVLFGNPGRLTWCSVSWVTRTTGTFSRF